MPKNEMSPAQAARVAKISRAPIEMTPVASSQIAAIGHNRETNTLAIKFAARDDEEVGGTYHYSGVDSDLFAAFRSAESIGSFFHKNIRPNTEEFPYVCVEGAVKKAAA